MLPLHRPPSGFARILSLRNYIIFHINDSFLFGELRVYSSTVRFNCPQAA
jgi:hypothetical protein